MLPVDAVTPACPVSPSSLCWDTSIVLQGTCEQYYKFYDKVVITGPSSLIRQTYVTLCTFAVITPRSDICLCSESFGWWIQTASLTYFSSVVYWSKTGHIAVESPKCSNFVHLPWISWQSGSATEEGAAAALSEPLGVPKSQRCPPCLAQSSSDWDVQGWPALLLMLSHSWDLPGRNMTVWILYP